MWVKNFIWKEDRHFFLSSVIINNISFFLEAGLESEEGQKGVMCGDSPSQNQAPQSSVFRRQESDWQPESKL